MQKSYDIIIIGAGPAGLSATRKIAAAEQGVSALLLDMLTPWEHPIQCAEAVGKLGFEESAPMKSSWVRNTITKASFHPPGAAPLTYTDTNGGFIIDRAAMQKDMTHDLISKGVDCAFDRRVTGIAGLERTMRTVHFRDGGSVRGRVVIDASGPVACLGRDEPISWKPFDLEPAYFIYAENIDIPPDTVHMYTGKEIAPGGYAWVFPRGSGAANIGVLVGSMYRGKVNVRELLDTFIARRFKGISIVNHFAGAIPCGYRRGPLAVPGLIKTGDAASSVNPISRAGITEAMLSGGLAGDHALLMLAADDEKKVRRICTLYEKAWYKKRGRKHEKLAKVKNNLAVVPDEDYNRAAHALTAIPREKLTMSKIFVTALGRFPRLAWALRHLM